MNKYHKALIAFSFLSLTMCEKVNKPERDSQPIDGVEAKKKADSTDIE